MSNAANSSSARRRVAALIAHAVTILLLVAMFVATHLPAHMSPGLSFSDKIIHFFAFMTLTMLLLVSWELSLGNLQPHHYFAVWLFCTLYGAFDEVTQIPAGRVCDGLDWLADVAGIVVGLTVYRLVRPLWGHLLPSAGVQ